MEYITFKQFIYTINIRELYKSENDESLQGNTTIRIYHNNIKSKDYVEIGWYDYHNKDTSWELLKEVLNEQILDSIVTDFRYNEDYSCFEVYVSSKEEMGCTLEEYQN